MSYTVVVGERAQRDISEAARWVSRHSPEKAALWHFEIEEAVLSLENFPLRCPLAPENEFFKEEIRQLLLVHDADSLETGHISISQLWNVRPQTCLTSC